MAPFEIVLWGIGHTNLEVVRRWRSSPIAGARLTCVSDGPTAVYSGMLPGVLAGQYARERMEIDLARLCDAPGVRLLEAGVAGLDLAGRRVILVGRAPLPFDALAIGIGSVPSFEGVNLVGSLAIAIKPLPTFLTRLDERLRELAAALDGGPLRVAVVGGGAGGVEIAFCLRPEIRRILGDRTVELWLLEADRTLGAGLRMRTARRIRRTLEARGIELRVGHRVVGVEGGTVRLDDSTTLPADLVVWATGARGPSILRTLGLPTDERGFVLTQPTLQVLEGAPVFVVGDSGTIVDSPAPKAGVYAVRQAPILWENLGRFHRGRPLVPFHPQAGFLKLLNTGDGSALGEFRGFSFQGRWCRRLKDQIDRRFVDRYRVGPSG